MLTGTWDDVIHGVFVLLRIMLEFCFFVGLSWVQFKFLLDQFGLSFRINPDKGGIQAFVQGELKLLFFSKGGSAPVGA